MIRARASFSRLRFLEDRGYSWVVPPTRGVGRHSAWPQPYYCGFKTVRIILAYGKGLWEMHAVVIASHVYPALAVSVLLLHALFILWVVFGALFTRSRPLLRWLHIASLIWGILIEVLPWPCPLTLLENWLESKAGIEPAQGGFLLHHLDRLVYPDISPTVLTLVAVVVCGLNLMLYVRRMWIDRGQ